MDTLRSKIIRLAHQKPELRQHLLPILTKTAARKPLTRESVACLGAAAINKLLDVLDKESSKITDELIEAGRGHEYPSETRKKSDPLSVKFTQTANDQFLLRMEIERRYGPGAPRRLPRGFGPLSTSDCK